MSLWVLSLTEVKTTGDFIGVGIFGHVFIFRDLHYDGKYGDAPMEEFMFYFDNELDEIINSASRTKAISDTLSDTADLAQ